jgi:hypothetical protein
MTSSILSHFSYVLFPQLLSRGGADVPSLLAGVARVWEAVAVQDSATFHVGDAEDHAALVEDRATLVGREALERVSRAEVENTAALASTCEDVESLVWKISLHEDVLVVEHWAGKCLRGSTKHNMRSAPFYRPVALSCVTPSLVPHDRGRELTAFRAAVSSTTESVLGCSPSDTSCTKVVGELAAEFQKVEDRCSRLERPAARICNLLLGPLPVQAQLANHLGEDVGHL